MLKKPNRNQAVYIATLLATFATAFFAGVGLPAFVNVINAVNLPDSMYSLIGATLFSIILFVLGYWMLDDNASRKD